MEVIQKVARCSRGKIKYPKGSGKLHKRKGMLLCNKCLKEVSDLIDR